MRELVQSRAVMAMLVSLYAVSLLGAIPMPIATLAAAPERPSDIAAVTVSAEALHATYCPCVGCSPTNCCCAMSQPVYRTGDLADAIPNDGSADGRDDGRIVMLGFSCQPTLTWFLALMPPTVVAVEAIGAAGQNFAAGLPGVLADRAECPIGVATPPPRCIA